MGHLSVSSFRGMPNSTVQQRHLEPEMKVIVLLTVVSLLTCAAVADDRVLLDPADVSGWQGLESDASVSRKGLPSARWDHAKASAVKCEAIPHDWSGYNCLSFVLHSAKATGASFMVVLSSEAASEGFDYFGFPITLDWTGWKEFDVPFNEMGRARNPVGWNKIDSVMFTADGWGNQPNPESVVHIADLRLTHSEGPWISDTEFFDMLDLDRPGLEKVKAAAASGDLTAAKHEFAEYLRRRDRPNPEFDWKARPKHDSRPQGVDTKEADRVLQRDLQSVSVYHKFDGEIDWNLNPIDYKEWPWQLNRHPFWVTLARAYWDTGDEKYAREFVYQMTDWVRRCPAPRLSSGNATYTWRTIESGIRTGQTWPEAFFRFLTSPSFTDEAVVTMVKSFAEHARQLMRWPTSGNWLAMECNGLMHVGVLFPEFKEAESWRKTAAERLYAELDRQVYPDGAQIELTTGYHQVSLGNFVAAWRIAHLNDVPMPEDFIAKVGRMYDYNINAAMPDASLPGLNDASRFSIRKIMEQGFGFFPERKDYEWIATSGKSGEKPKVGSIALPFSGQLVMRTGWDPNDLYLLMDAGPFGYGHQHEDALSFVIYAHGKYHLIDPGNYAYDSSKWRRYVLSTRAHNTIMVDGLDQHRGGKSRELYVVSKPLPNRWAASDGFDYACGTYSEGYGGGNQVKVTHSRHIFFAKPDYWIVTDFMTPSDAASHKYESMFHLDADSAEIDADRRVRTVNKSGGNLTILPVADDELRVRIASGEEEPEVQGWIPSAAYKCRPIPTPIFTREAAGPTGFLYLFYPTPERRECPVTKIEPLHVTGGRAAAAAITFSDGRVDYFLQPASPSTKLKFLDYETDAEAVLIRTSGGRTVAAFRAGGTYLTQSGEPVEARSQPVRDLSETEERHTF